MDTLSELAQIGYTRHRLRYIDTAFFVDEPKTRSASITFAAAVAVHNGNFKNVVRMINRYFQNSENDVLLLLVDVLKPRVSVQSGFLVMPNLNYPISDLYRLLHVVESTTCQVGVPAMLKRLKASGN